MFIYNITDFAPSIESFLFYVFNASWIMYEYFMSILPFALLISMYGGKCTFFSCFSYILNHFRWFYYTLYKNGRRFWYFNCAWICVVELFFYIIFKSYWLFICMLCREDVCCNCALEIFLLLVLLKTCHSLLLLVSVSSFLFSLI